MFVTFYKSDATLVSHVAGQMNVLEPPDLNYLVWALDLHQNPEGCLKEGVV